ncbi:MAG TPA: hypothetical protein VNO79_15430 [Actinomycetota bacterium]|nr:hypothetical protein [Actinomycetota bacterium]
MPCPCCLAAVGPPPVTARTGDLWCARCKWLFAAELLGEERDPLRLERWLRCPTHRRPAEPTQRQP